MTKKMSQKIAFLTLGLFLTSFSLPFQRAQAEASREPVRVGLLASKLTSSYMPFYVAMEKGYFKDAGIQIETPPTNIEFGSAKDYEESFDVCVMGRVQQYIIEGTIPGYFSVFAEDHLSQSHPNYAILVRKDSKVKSLAELEGKTIGLEEHAGHARARVVLMSLILKDLKLDPKKFEMKNCPIESLENGEVEALYIREPELSIAMSRGKSEVLIDEPVVRHIMGPWPMSFASLTTKFLKKDPETSAKIISCWNKAIDYIRAHPEESQKLFDRYTEQALGMKLQVKQLDHWKLDEIDRSIVQRQINLYYDHGVLPQRISPDAIIPRLAAKAD